MDLVTITLSPIQRAEIVATMESTIVQNREQLAELLPVADAFIRAERDGDRMHVDIERVSATVLANALPSMMRNIPISRGRALLALEQQLTERLQEAPP